MFALWSRTEAVERVLPLAALFCHWEFLQTVVVSTGGLESGAGQTQITKFKYQ